MNNTQIFERACGVWRQESEGVSGLSKVIDPEVFGRVARAIAECRGRVVVTGCGTSAAAARKIAHSLCCIERPAAFLSPSDAVHGALGLLQREDVFIVISKGGGTSELTKLIPACKAKGALLVVVSEKPESTLAKAADVFLFVRVLREPDEFNMLATASTMAVIAVFDAMCIVLMELTGYSREQFAVIHPGGAVGERLLRGEK